MFKHKDLPVIGSTTKVSFPVYGISDVPAKVDTGADSSSIWASNIHEKDGVLSFALFDKTSPHYNGQVISTKKFTMRLVKNSFGKSEMRYKVTFTLEIEGKKLKARFTLANRSRNRYPILIGRRTLHNRFLVDVAQYRKRTDIHVLVLVTKHISSVNKFLDKIQKETKEDIHFTLATYDDLQIEVAGDVHITLPDSKVDVASFDLIYFKTSLSKAMLAATVANYAKARGVPFIDPVTRDGAAVSKIHQYTLLKDVGIQVPHTLFMSQARLKKSYSKVAGALGTPFILKDTDGEKGRHNYLIKTKKEFEGACKAVAAAKVQVVAQQFIPNDGDYRVLVLARKVALVIYRQSADKDSHLNNVSTGAKAQLMNKEHIPGVVHAASIRASELLGFEIAGVDMVQDKETGSWYCLEVNNSPQLASGAFVDEKRSALAQFLRDASRV